MAKEKLKVSPTNSKRGCQCADGSYSKECCDGSLQAQGVGALVEQGTSNVQNTNSERVIINSRG